MENGSKYPQLGFGYWQPGQKGKGEIKELVKVSKSKCHCCCWRFSPIQQKLSNFQHHQMVPLQALQPFAIVESQRLGHNLILLMHMEKAKPSRKAIASNQSIQSWNATLTITSSQICHAAGKICPDGNFAVQFCQVASRERIWRSWWNFSPDCTDCSCKKHQWQSKTCPWSYWAKCP